MKSISTMLISLLAICLGAMSFNNKDFSFDQPSARANAANQNTHQLRVTNTFSKDFTTMTASRSISGPVQGQQDTLWTPVSEIEDGAIYMIRCAENPDLYWDLTQGHLFNGTQVQLYNLNYTHAQKFYFKKSFDINGNATYQLSPLYAYTKVLRFENKTENSILKVDDERYNIADKDLCLYSDKIYFTQSVNPTRFYAHTCFSNNSNSGNTYVSVQSASSGNKIKIKDSSLPSNRFIFSWELIKTDYVGLQVGNLTYINGTNEIRYVARVPYTGRYIIETRPYGGNYVDTYLTLKRDFTNATVAINDDGGEGRNAKITYNFNTTDEYSILVRGYNDNHYGFCYLVLRPEKTIYLTGTYDYSEEYPGEMVTPVVNAAPHLRAMGYFPIVQTNLSHDRVFNERDWEGTVKMDRDYYVFSGHGGNGGIYAVYQDGPNGDWVLGSDYNTTKPFPNLSNVKLAVWLCCQGANEPTSGSNHCLARFSTMKGAQMAVGFRGLVNKLAYQRFANLFFQKLKTKSVQTSLEEAAQTVRGQFSDQGGMQFPSIFKDGGHTEIQITINGQLPQDIQRETVYHN